MCLQTLVNCDEVLRGMQVAVHESLSDETAAQFFVSLPLLFGIFTTLPYYRQQ